LRELLAEKANTDQIEAALHEQQKRFDELLKRQEEKQRQKYLELLAQQKQQYEEQLKELQRPINNGV